MTENYGAGGYPQPPNYNPVQTGDEYRNARRGFAVTALVLGILAVCFSWVPFFGWALCILAIVFGALSLRHGMGKAGLALGIIGAVLATVLYVAIFAGGNSTTTTLNRLPAPAVTGNALTTPQPGSPIGTYDTSKLDVYLAVLQDQSDLTGNPPGTLYTDAQLTTYGEEACTDNASLDPVGASLQLALDESIPNYDAGYITGVAINSLCAS